MENEVKKVTNDFLKEIGIEESGINYLAIRNLQDEILRLVKDAEQSVVPADDCNCTCDSCEACEYS